MVNKVSVRKCFSDAPYVPLMPLVLSHETFAEGAIFERPNEVSIPTMRATCASTACPSTTRSVRISGTIRSRRIIRRTGLKANRCIRIQVASDALDGGVDATLLLVHGGGTLTPSSCGCLSVQTLRWSILLLRNVIRSLHHAHLMPVTRGLRRIRRRCSLLMPSVYTVVHWRSLVMGRRTIRVHLLECIR